MDYQIIIIQYSIVPVFSPLLIPTFIILELWLLIIFSVYSIYCSNLFSGYFSWTVFPGFRLYDFFKISSMDILFTLVFTYIL